MVPGHSPSGASPSTIPSALSGASSRGAISSALQSDRNPRRQRVGADVLDDPGAIDPMLQIAVRRPIDLSPSSWRRVAVSRCNLPSACSSPRWLGGCTLSRGLGVARVGPSGRPACSTAWRRLQRSRVPRRRPLCDGMLPGHPGLLCDVGGGRSSRVVDVAVVDRNRQWPRSRAPARLEPGSRFAATSGPITPRPSSTRSIVRHRSRARRHRSGRTNVALLQHSRAARHDDIPAAVLGFLRPAAGLRLFVSTGSARRCSC